MFLTKTIQEGLHSVDERLSKKYEMLGRGTAVLMFYCFHARLWPKIAVTVGLIMETLYCHLR